MGTGVSHDLWYSETTRPTHRGCLGNIPVSGGGLTGWFVMSDLIFLAPGPSRGGRERRVTVFPQGLPPANKELFTLKTDRGRNKDTGPQRTPSPGLLLVQ